MIRKASMSIQSDIGPTRRSTVGTLLMLPIGLIIVLLLLLSFVAFRRVYFPGGTHSHSCGHISRIVRHPSLVLEVEKEVLA
jgi:hypothetical protein